MDCSPRPRRSVFYEFYQTDTIGEPYVLRELDLSQELSVKRRGR